MSYFAKTAFFPALNRASQKSFAELIVSFGTASLFTASLKELPFGEDKLRIGRAGLCFVAPLPSANLAGNFLAELSGMDPLQIFS
jgi:hypothetical protein